MIRFKVIRWKNFLSTGNVWTEVILDDIPMKLFIGENGNGKSTILDAICYVLYNTPFRDFNLPQLVNSVNGKNLLVEIEFTIGRTHYLVRRGMKPAVFEIHRNSELQKQDGKNTDYQATFERDVLKMDFKTFKSVVVLGSGSFVPFMRLKKAERRTVMEDLMKLTIFTKMNLVQKEEEKTLKKEFETVETEIKNLNDKIDLERKRLDYMKGSVDDRIKNIFEQIELLKGRVAEETSLRDALMVDIALLEEQVTEEDKTRDRKEAADNFKHKLEAQIDRFNEMIEFYTKNSTCPTCYQPIQEGFKAEAVEKCESGLHAKGETLAKLNEEREALISKLKFIQTTNSKIRELNIQLAVHNTNISNLFANEEKMLGEINRLQAENESIRKDDHDLKAFTKALKENTKRREELLVELELSKAAGVSLKDEAIKAQVIKKYVPEMNRLINKYLATLDFPCKFTLDETFTETIKSRYRDNFVYESFSNGQKLRIDLALLFAWRAMARHRNSAATNLLIMDEIFDSALDRKGLDQIPECLAKLGKDTNIIVISPKGEEMQGKFDHVYKFELTKNFSKMSKVEK